MSHKQPAACPRCGRKRPVAAEHTGRLCRDCHDVEPGWPAWRTKDKQS